MLKNIRTSVLCTILSMLFFLCACNSQELRPIEQIPYPATAEGEIHTDYWSSRSMDELWNRSDLIVIGRYIDTAPESVNMNRMVEDPSKEATIYMEDLVYQFKIEAILKGTEDTNQIPIGIFHGKREGNEVVPCGEFIQPDPDRFMLLFLRASTSDYCDYYRVTGKIAWLSTDEITQNIADADWEQLMFFPDGLKGRDTPIIFDYDSTTMQDGIAVASADYARTYYTGAELLGLAK